MNVKGIAFLSRKSEIIAMFGEKRWIDFMETLKNKTPFFNDHVYPAGRIPLEYFLAFEELMLKTFFNDDPKWYWELGKRGAIWSFTEGPFKTLTQERDLGEFLKYAPQSVWKSYYNFGEIRSWMDEEGVVHAQILNLPIEHPHFELSTMGFYEGALSVMGGSDPLPNKESPPDEEISVYYTFMF